MTTLTSLSAAPSVSVAQALLPVRFCCGKAREMAPVATSLTIAFLIANLELEFHPTHRKLSLLRISNRKYFAVFDPAVQDPRFSRPVTCHLGCTKQAGHRRRSLAYRFLIYGSAIKKRRNPLQT